MLTRIQTAVTKLVDEHLEAAALYLFQHRGRVVLFDAIATTLTALLGAGSWALWAHVLLLQNWAFTYVSRARNSGSLARHLRAGFLSNFVWWISQIIIFTKLFDYIRGAHGIRNAVLTGFYYTAFTLTGSIAAHAQSLRNEKGKAAVGANAKLKQVTVEEWSKVEAVLGDFARVSNLAEQAHICAVGALPEGGSATKIAGEIITSIR